MKKASTAILSLFISLATFGQEIDTLTFYSNALEAERQVFIKKPKTFKYKSDSVQPVIFVLDGQHEWFVNPLILISRQECVEESKIAG